ncbi:MAG TPA: tetratricopeptide repeat protein [Gammaproteobacteria bacterium]|nr:tetratricopeptide repeat protein [Gammaproteobacteria bacterium]
MDKKDTKEVTSQSFRLIQNNLSTPTTEIKNKKLPSSSTTPLAPTFTIKDLQEFITSAKNLDIGKPYEAWLNKHTQTPRQKLLSISNTLALIQQDATGYFKKLPVEQRTTCVASLLQLFEKTLAPLSTYLPLDEQTARTILSSLDCLTDLPSAATPDITRTSACLLTNLCRLADNCQLSACLPAENINTLITRLAQCAFKDKTAIFQQIITSLKHLIEISVVQDDGLLDFKSLFFLIQQTIHATNDPQILAEMMGVAKILVHYKPDDIEIDFEIFRSAINCLLEICQQPTKSNGDSKNTLLSADNIAKAIGKTLLDLGATIKGRLLYAELTEEDFQIMDELLEQLLIATQKKPLDRESSWHITHALLGSVWSGQPKLDKETKDTPKKLAEKVETYISAAQNQTVFSLREFRKLTNQLIFFHYGRREKHTSWPLVLQKAIKTQRPLLSDMTFLMQQVRDRLTNIKKSPKKYQNFIVSFVDPEFNFGPFFADIFLKVITPHHRKNLRLPIEDNGSTHEGIIAAGRDFLRACLIKFNDDADDIVDIDTWQRSYTVDDVMKQLERTVAKHDENVSLPTEEKEKKQSHTRLCHHIVQYLSQPKMYEILRDFTAPQLPLLDSASTPVVSTASSSSTSFSTASVSSQSGGEIPQSFTPREEAPKELKRIKDKIPSKSKQRRKKKSQVSAPLKKTVSNNPQIDTNLQPQVVSTHEDKKQTVKDHPLGTIKYQKPNTSHVNPKKALQLYLQSHRNLQRVFNLARQNDPAAQKILGDLYTHGLVNLKQDKKAAVAWYRLAAEEEYPPAQYNLATCYHNGYGVEKDFKEAFEWYKAAAENNFAQAQYQLGANYYDGEGVTQNIKEAIHWLSKAAEQNNPDAQCKLGYHYSQKGVDQDFAKALALYRKAAEQNDSVAEFNIGACYFYGEGVNRNLEIAITHFQKSIEHGNLAAYLALGICYLGKKDYKAAFDCFTRSAAQNDAVAQWFLARCFQNGEGTDKDINAAFYWNNRAASQGVAPAQYNVGMAYLHGNGIKQDKKTGFNFLKLAADQHWAEAEHQIAFCYRDGNGTKRDESLMLEYFKRAAEQNLPQAQANLGNCYIMGKGTPQDAKAAFTNYEKAAIGELPEAQVNLALCYYNGDGVERNLLLAAKWLSKATSLPKNFEQTKQTVIAQILTGLETKAKSNSIAQYELGMLYERGWLVEKDISKAISWYQKAEKQNHTEAKQRASVLTRILNPQKDKKNLAPIAPDSPIRKESQFPDKKVSAMTTSLPQSSDANGQCELGCRYYEGKVVKQDLLTAIQWFDKAMRQANQIHSGLREKSIFYIQQILSMVEEGVEQNDTQSLYIFGLVHEHGWLVEEDKSKAIEMYQAAAAKGHSESENRLNKLNGKTLTSL